MDQIILTHDLVALAQVVMIDITLAGDNAIVVGMAVAGLPQSRKRPAIVFGILGATAIRIALGAVALQLLAIIGLLLAGGVLLLWVCWRMFRELRQARAHGAQEPAERKSLGEAMTQIILADLSMSLDNVLAVAGAANFLARVLERARWVAWIGLAIVLYVAVVMIWEGAFDVADAIRP